MKLRPLLCAVLLAAVGCTSTQTPSNSVPTAPLSSTVEGRSKPQLLFRECKSLPEYPRMSRERRETGTVRIAMNVDATGLVTRAEVVQSSGFTALDQVAMASLSRRPFLPALKNREPVESAVEITYVWKLQ